MFSRLSTTTRSLLSGAWNHKKKVILFSVFFIGSAIVARKGYRLYRKLAADLSALAMLDSFGQDGNIDHRLGKESEKARRLLFDENASRIHDVTIRKLLPLLKSQLDGATDDPSSLVAQVRECRSLDEKLKVYENLRALAFTRTICAVYLTTLVDIIRRLQLATISRYLYIGSRRREVSETQTLIGLDEDALRSEGVAAAFLQKGDYIQSHGLRKLVDIVSEAARTTLSGVDLRIHVGSRDVIQLIEALRQKIEGRDVDNNIEYSTTNGGTEGDGASVSSGVLKVSKLLDCFLPPESDDSAVDGVLVDGDISTPGAKLSLSEHHISIKHLMDELRDTIDGPDFSIVLQRSLDLAFIVVSDKLHEEFGGNISMTSPHGKLSKGKIISINASSTNNSIINSNSGGTANGIDPAVVNQPSKLVTDMTPIKFVTSTSQDDEQDGKSVSNGVPTPISNSKDSNKLNKVTQPMLKIGPMFNGLYHYVLHSPDNQILSAINTCSDLHSLCLAIKSGGDSAT